jgi:DNA-binding NarL/FixJ family response regulator
MGVVGEAENSATAIRLAHELKPDVILIDVNMSGMNGIDTTRQISKALPNVKIVALSMYSQRTFATEMLRAGASGYVLKYHAFSELIKAIKAVVDDEIYLCPRTTNIIVGDYIQSRSGGGGSSDTSLTKRERDVLKLLADGKNTKQIALELHISTKTVDSHRRHIMSKLDLYSLPELTKHAVCCGLTSVE